MQRVLYCLIWGILCVEISLSLFLFDYLASFFFLWCIIRCKRKKCFSFLSSFLTIEKKNIFFWRLSPQSDNIFPSSFGLKDNPVLMLLLISKILTICVQAVHIFSYKIDDKTVCTWHLKAQKLYIHIFSYKIDDKNVCTWHLKGQMHKRRKESYAAVKTIEWRLKVFLKSLFRPQHRNAVKWIAKLDNVTSKPKFFTALHWSENC